MGNSHTTDIFFTTNFSTSRGSQPCKPYYLVRLRWAGLPPGSVASRRRAVGCGGQRRRDRSSSCSGTKGRRGPRSGELPRLLERGGGCAGGVARRGALFRGQGGSTATFRNSLSLEEYGLMSPSALFGGSFLAGVSVGVVRPPRGSGAVE